MTVRDDILLKIREHGSLSLHQLGILIQFKGWLSDLREIVLLMVDEGDLEEDRDACRGSIYGLPRVKARHE